MEWYKVSFTIIAISLIINIKSPPTISIISHCTVCMTGPLSTYGSENIVENIELRRSGLFGRTTDKY